MIFAAIITRYAPLRWVVKNAPDSYQHHEAAEQILNTGIQRARPDAIRFGKTNPNFAHPTEVRSLMESEGFKTLDLIACEGVVSLIEEKINELSVELWEAWVELNYRLGRDPSIHGAAEHVLYAGRKVQR